MRTGRRASFDPVVEPEQVEHVGRPERGGVGGGERKGQVVPFDLETGDLGRDVGDDVLFLWSGDCHVFALGQLGDCRADRLGVGPVDERDRVVTLQQPGLWRRRRQPLDRADDQPRLVVASEPVEERCRGEGIGQLQFHDFVEAFDPECQRGGKRDPRLRMKPLGHRKRERDPACHPFPELGEIAMADPTQQVPFFEPDAIPDPQRQLRRVGGIRRLGFGHGSHVRVWSAVSGQRSAGYVGSLTHDQFGDEIAQSVDQVQVDVAGGFELHHALGDLFALGDRDAADRLFDPRKRRRRDAQAADAKA